MHVAPDGTGAKCSIEAPCGTFNAAYQAARRGDTVQVAAGSYGEQVIEPRALRGRNSRRPSGEEITFEGPGATVDGMALSSVRGAPVEHIAFEDLVFVGWTAIHSGEDVHFTRTTHRAQLHANWVRYLSYRNIAVGPFTDSTGDGLQFNQIDGRAGHHLLIQGSRIHDVHPDSSAAHPDAIQFYGPYHDVTLRGNRLWNNDNINLRGDGTMRRYVVENNFFGAAGNPVVPSYYTAQIQGNGAVIRYNSFAGALQPSGPNERSGQVWEGNIMTWTTCAVAGSDSTVRYNVWVGGVRCGSSRAAVKRARFVDAARGDLHLRPGSAALGKGNPSSYPARDIDGQSRPAGRRPDAGADEFERSGSRPRSDRVETLAMRSLFLPRTGGLVLRLHLSWPRFSALPR